MTAQPTPLEMSTPGTLRETIARLWYVQSEPGEVECKRCHAWGDPGRTDWHEANCQVVVLFALADAWADDCVPETQGGPKRSDVPSKTGVVVTLLVLILMFAANVDVYDENYQKEVIAHAETKRRLEAAEKENKALKDAAQNTYCRNCDGANGCMDCRGRVVHDKCEKNCPVCYGDDASVVGLWELHALAGEKP